MMPCTRCLDCYDRITPAAPDEFGRVECDDCRSALAEAAAERRYDDGVRDGYQDAVEERIALRRNE